jgi:hypothetical protein
MTAWQAGLRQPIPGDAVHVPANNAHARVGRAGRGLAGPGKSSPRISSPPISATPHVAPGVGSGSSTAAYDHPDFNNPEAVTGYDGAARAPPKNGRVNWRKRNAFRPGIMLFDRSLCFCERRRKRASCQIATCYRSSRPGCDPKLRHAGWCAGLSRRLSSGWSSDRPRRPSCLR